MQIALMSISAVLFLAATGYAQQKIPLFTKGSRVLLTRAGLVLVGIGFGLAASAPIEDRLLQLLTFVAGFGLVHVPAAIILFIKGRRTEGIS